MRRFLPLLLLAAHPGLAPAGDILRVPEQHPNLAAALKAARPGDTVLAAPGDYRETSLLVPAGVTLRSAGADAPGKQGFRRAEATLLHGGGAKAIGPAVRLAEGAVLDGFTITGVGLFDEKEFQKHHATQGEHLPDDRGAVGKEFPAVLIDGVSATVRNCLVHDNGRPGIGVQGKGNRSEVAGNVVFRNMGGGIGVADGAEPLVRGNRCFRNLRGGIGNRASAGLLLDNECFENVRAGIGIREGARPIVRGNRCHHNRRAGIGIRMNDTAPVVEGNDCWANDMAGIGCRDGARPILRGNLCRENALAGIGAQGGARPLIVGNECRHNQLAGIGMKSDVHAVVIDNHVHHNKKAGIGFETSKDARALLQGNRVVANDLVAVGIHAGWKVRLLDNHLEREGGLPPLVMVFKGAEADFTGNRFIGSGVAGIRAEGKVLAIDNRFECPAPRKGGPPQFAVWGLPGSSIELRDNRIAGWRPPQLAK